jgi:hypothetical protein
MNYSECNQVLKYLDRNDLESLRNYVQKKRESYYLTSARDLLKKYLNSKESFYNIMEESLLITDCTSAYFFDDYRLLTDKYIKNLDKQCNFYMLDKCSEIVQIYDKFLNMESMPVGKIVSYYPNLDYHKLMVYEVFSEDGSYSKRIAKDKYDNAKILLGENTQYEVLKEKPVCLVRSPRGRGFVLGVNKRD